MNAIAAAIERFNRLDLDGAHILEWSFDPGIKLSLTLLQNPEQKSVGGLCKRWDLHCSQIQTANVKLHHSPAHIQVLSHKASLVKKGSTNLIELSLACSSGTVEVTGADIAVVVTEEIPVTTAKLNP